MKIIKFVATRCQILRLKCTKFDFGTKICQFRHHFDFPAGEAYSAPPDPVAGFKGPTSRGEVKGGEGKREEGRGEGRKGKGGDPQGLVHTPKFEILKSTLSYGSCKLLNFALWLLRWLKRLKFKVLNSHTFTDVCVCVLYHRSKDFNMPHYPLTVVFDLIHNHPIAAGDVLRCRDDLLKIRRFLFGPYCTETLQLCTIKCLLYMFSFFSHGLC